MASILRRRRRLFGTAPVSAFLNFTDQGVGVSSQTVTVSGVAGDLWIGFEQFNQASRTIAAPTVSGAAWTELFSIQHASNANFRAGAWWKLLTTSESNPQFNIGGGASDEWGAGVIVVKGVNLVTPIDVVATSNTGTGTSMTCPDALTTGTNRRILRLGFASGNPVVANSNYPVNTNGLFLQKILGAENAQCTGAAWHDQPAQGQTGTAVFSNAIESANSLKATIAVALA